MFVHDDFSHTVIFQLLKITIWGGLLCLVLPLFPNFAVSVLFNSTKTLAGNQVQVGALGSRWQ
jgi:hypothetical protein